MKSNIKNNYLKFLSSKVFLSASFGNILEFYDFATYGFLIPVMAPLFFPAESSLTSLLMAFGVFAISFIVRPLGGIFFGYIGDFYGRKTTFSLSLIFMAMATTFIGILPTYDKIGLLSPFLLIFCRLIQGLCLGGEFSGSLIFVTEHLNNQKSAFVTSAVTSAGVGGWFLSSIICTLTSNLSQPYSWRIPFLLGAAVGILGYYIRRSTVESPIELNATSENIWKTLKYEWMTAFSIIGIGALMGGLFYGLHIFPNSFLPAHFPFISHAQALKCTSIGIGIYMISLPFMGWVADRINHTKCMQFFCLLTILFSFPIFYFLMSGCIFYILLAEGLASVLLAGFMAPATFVMAESFLPSFRHRMVSFSYNLGASLIGGTTPIVFLFLIESLDLLYSPGLFIALCGFIGLFSSYYLGKKTDLKILPIELKMNFASKPS